jgi:ATP-dependent RNA helicase DDX18/HAS1
MMLIGFIRSHLNDSIIIVCAGPCIAEYLAILTNNLDIHSSAAEMIVVYGEKSALLQGKQERSQRTASFARFNSGEVDFLFGSAIVLSTAEFTRRPTWVVHYDIPRSSRDELRLIRHLNPLKFIILLDPSYSEYLERLTDVKINTQLLKFDDKKIPKLQPEVFSLCEKNYPLYQASEYGYREFITTYVNHEYAELFDATKLPILDVAHTFGIKAPPKLPLTK